jgi:hypothetical protein
MPRLRSRTEHPPYSFQHLTPEVGQTTPFTGSFNYVVEQVITLRKANPFLCERHGWSTDVAAVEAEIDAYNTARCIAGGWLGFVVMDDQTPVPSYPAEKKTPRRSAGVVGGAKRVAAGVALLMDWIGPSVKAVPHELAEQRAAICATCPLNGKGGLLEYFTSAAAEKIRTQLAIRTDLQLSTSFDSQLGTCTACMCFLPLKTHVPIEFVLKHTSDEVRTALDPRCWVLKGT